jgi:hypothetical protein
MIFHYQKIEIVGDWMLLLLLLLLTFSPCVYLFRMASNVTARGMNLVIVRASPRVQHIVCVLLASTHRTSP